MRILFAPVLLTVVVTVTSIVPGISKKYFYSTNKTHFDKLKNGVDVDSVSAANTLKEIILYIQTREIPVFLVKTRRRKTQRPRVEYSPGSIKSDIISKTSNDLDNSFKNHLKKLMDIKDDKEEKMRDLNANTEN